MKLLRVVFPLVCLPFMGGVGCSRPPEAAAYAADWDFSGPMLTVARRYTGVPGVVLHVGDSNTLDPAYAAWALDGDGKTPENTELLGWMHAGSANDLDGWTLCSRPTAPRRSATAANGIQLIQFLAGENVDYSFRELVRRYNPQIVVLMLGTNDASADRSIREFSAGIRQAIDILIENGTVPLMITLPPHGRRSGRIDGYNRAIQAVSREKKLPVVDLYGEIFRLRPGDWNNTLMQADGLHLSKGSAKGPVNHENLNHSGQLLRAWLTIGKIAEIKTRVFDVLNEHKHGKNR